MPPTPPTKPVLVIGDVNTDLILTGLSGHPRYGREVLVSGCALTLGGSAALFACGLSRLGRKVKFLGKVGSDPMGAFALAKMSARGVDVSAVRRDPKIPTGIAVAFTETTDRALVSYLGTVSRTGPREVDPGGLRAYSHLHLTSPFLQLGLAGSFVGLLRRARRAGLTTSLDPGWDPRGRWDLGPLYPWIDVLLLNGPEARALSGKGSPAAAAQALAGRVAMVVVKAGARGAVAATSGALWKAKSYPVDPIDTTGAGDTFDAGFVDGWLEGHRTQEILAYACACGALSTLKAGGYDGQPTRREALGRVSQGERPARTSGVRSRAEGREPR